MNTYLREEFLLGEVQSAVFSNKLPRVNNVRNRKGSKQNALGFPAAPLYHQLSASPFFLPSLIPDAPPG